MSIGPHRERSVCKDSLGGKAGCAETCLSGLEGGSRKPTSRETDKAPSFYPYNREQELRALLDFIKQNQGFDFSGYKHVGLIRRMDKRLQAVGVEQFSDYVDYLQVHPEEFAYLFNAVLINVTSFFREPPAWDYLTSEVIPQLIAAKPADQPIRVWSAGCASGEEAYTLAIILAEALGPEQLQCPTKWKRNRTLPKLIWRRSRIKTSRGHLRCSPAQSAGGPCGNFRKMSCCDSAVEPGTPSRLTVC
jgi:hypothetical protein